MDAESERRRLEELWGGEFGDAYTDRNAAAGAARSHTWRSLLEELEIGSALEIGCNVGANLQHVAGILPRATVIGLDINMKSLETMRRSVPSAIPVRASAAALPFEDASFDLVFTVGVLIHQPEETLGQVMGEIVRCSRRFVLAAEYASETTEEVPYRGQKGALFRRNYRQLYERSHPELTVVKDWFAGQDHGFDDVTFTLLVRSA